jgi:outer membrane protein
MHRTQLSDPSTSDSSVARAKWAMAATVGLLSLLVASPVFAEDLKIGYVNLQKALNQVDEGKQAKQKLKKQFKSKQQKLNQKQKEVKKLREELKSQSMALSKEARRKKKRKLRRKMQELQRLYMGAQRELTKKEASATKEIFDKMRDIVEKIAEEKNYDMVLEKNKGSVLFAKDAMDLTDELVKRYNSSDK